MFISVPRFPFNFQFIFYLFVVIELTRCTFIEIQFLKTHCEISVEFLLQLIIHEKPFIQWILCVDIARIFIFLFFSLSLFYSLCFSISFFPFVSSASIFAFLWFSSYFIVGTCGVFILAPMPSTDESTDTRKRRWREIR